MGDLQPLLAETAHSTPLQPFPTVRFLGAHYEARMEHAEVGISRKRAMTGRRRSRRLVRFVRKRVVIQTIYSELLQPKSSHKGSPRPPFRPLVEQTPISEEKMSRNARSRWFSRELWPLMRFCQSLAEVLGGSIVCDQH